MDSDDPGADAGGDPSDTGDSREQGIDIGPLATELEEHSYPTTNERLLEQYGDYDIELSSGSRSLDDVLGERAVESETYESAEEVRQMIYNMVGEAAVGREDYSDRGDVQGEEAAREDESF